MASFVALLKNALKTISLEFLYKNLYKYVTEVKGAFTVFAKNKNPKMLTRKIRNQNKHKDSTTITLKIKRKKWFL